MTIDRVLLLDAENVLGSIKVRPRVLRARVSVLLSTAGAVHHAVAGYALAEGDEDPAASLFAELGVAPLRVPPGPDAAEQVLLAHARRIHAEHGCQEFLVSSADHAFAELAQLGRLELVLFSGQPIATRLSEAAHQIHTVTRPTTGQDRSETSGTDLALPAAAPGGTTPQSTTDRHGVVRTLLAATAAGCGFALGHRLADRLLPRGNTTPRE